MGERWGGGVDMDDEGDKERKESRDGMWGRAEKKGWGSHCHANWCSAQTLMSRKKKE